MLNPIKGIMENEYRNLRRENQRLKQTIEWQDQEIERLEREIERINQENEILERRIERSKTAIEQKDREIKRLKQEIKKAKWRTFFTDAWLWVKTKIVPKLVAVSTHHVSG